MFVAETSNYCKLIPTLLSRNQAKNRSILSLIVLYIYGVEKKNLSSSSQRSFLLWHLYVLVLVINTWGTYLYLKKDSDHQFHKICRRHFHSSREAANLLWGRVWRGVWMDREQWSPDVCHSPIWLSRMVEPGEAEEEVMSSIQSSV